MNDLTKFKFRFKEAQNSTYLSLLCSSSMLTLAACAGGGGGGVFGVGGSGASSRLMGGLLMKGTVVGARVFQDLDGDGVYDVGEPSAITNSEGLYNINFTSDTAPIFN